MASRSWIAAVVAAALLAPGYGLAEQSAEDAPRKRWGRTAQDEESFGEHNYVVDKRTGKKLSIARDALLEERYDDAQKALAAIRERHLNPLEKAQLYRLQAYTAYGQQDYATTREYMEKTIAQQVLTRSDVAGLRYQIAQLWFQEQNWEEGARNLERWLELVPEPTAAAIYMLALAYYQLDRFDEALSRAKQAVEMTPEPKEGWLQLYLSLRLSRKEYAESVPIIEELVRRFPKKQYWLSLSTVHGALGNYEEALIPLQIAYQQDLLVEQAELLRLAQLLLFLGLPYRSALVLEDGLEAGTIDPEDSTAWEMLSSSWINAREYTKATPPLERAAELSPDGNLYVRLAQVNIQREAWPDAERSLQRALEKSVAEPGAALLLMGITVHSQERPEDARKWFERARKHASSREEAERWLRYLAGNATSE